MRPRRTSDEAPSLADDDEGSAALEFIFAGVILLVPIVYLVVALGLIQSHALGVEAAARHVARAVATAEDAASADARTQRIVASITEEYGLDADALSLRIACTDGGACPASGQTLVVEVTSSVPLPLVPPVLGLDELTRVGVEASALQRVSRYWSGG